MEEANLGVRMQALYPTDSVVAAASLRKCEGILDENYSELPEHVNS